MTPGSLSRRRALQQEPDGGGAAHGDTQATPPPKKRQRALLGRRGRCLDAGDGSDGDGEAALTPARIDLHEISFPGASPDVKTAAAERRLERTSGRHRGTRAHSEQPFDDPSATVFNSTAGRRQIRALAAQDDDPGYLAGFEAPPLTPDDRAPTPSPPKSSSPRKRLGDLRRPTDPDSPWYRTEREWEKDLKAARDGSQTARKRLERAHHCGRISEECGESADPCDVCVRLGVTCEVYKKGEGDGSQCVWCRWKKKACSHAKSLPAGTGPGVSRAEFDRLQAEFGRLQAELRAVEEENAVLAAKVDALDRDWSERFGRVDDALRALQGPMAQD